MNYKYPQGVYHGRREKKDPGAPPAHRGAGTRSPANDRGTGALRRGPDPGLRRDRGNEEDGKRHHPGEHGPVHGRVTRAATGREWTTFRRPCQGTSIWPEEGIR